MSKKQIREQKMMRLINSYSISFADGWEWADCLECMRLRSRLMGGCNYNLAEQEYKKFMNEMAVKYAVK